MTRNIFGIHTSNTDYPPDTIQTLLSVSAVVKVLVLFSDYARLNLMRAWAPAYATWIGRHIVLDMEQRELHWRYWAVPETDGTAAYNLGVWFANMVADQAITYGLTWLFWESGPNEHNDVSPRAVWYARGFIAGCLARGIKPAVGGYSYGRPKVLELDGIDEWAQWLPVWRDIDAANRDSSGAPLAQPRAAFYLHEGAQSAGLVGSIPYTVRRYKFFYDRHIVSNGLWVPLFITEFAYGADYPGASKPPTEVLLQQIVDVNPILAQDGQVYGYGWYSFRLSDRNTFDDYSYLTSDLVRILQAHNYTAGGIIPPTGVPVPPPPPVEGARDMRVTVYAVNQRSAPSASAALLGCIGLPVGNNPPTRVRCMYPPTNGYVEVIGQNCWVLAANLTPAPN